MVETAPRRRASSLFFMSHSHQPVGLDPLKTGLCPVTSLEAEPSTWGPQGHSSGGGGNTRALKPGLLPAGPVSQGDSMKLGLYHLWGGWGGGSMAAEASQPCP